MEARCDRCGGRPAAPSLNDLQWALPVPFCAVVAASDSKAARRPSSRNSNGASAIGA
jgi:hypothetical protein